MTAHGTPLTGSGSPDVLVGGRPAWRAATDVHACPLSSGAVPHVGGVVAVGSSTVLINGVPAARQGDVIREHGPPNTIVSGDPTVLIDGGASAVQPSWVASLYERLSSYVGTYNEHVTRADLGIAGDRLRDERVNLHVAAEGANAVFSFRTDERNRIRTFRLGPRDDATLRMDTDRETVERITGADDPVAAFRDAIAADEITISGIGLANEVEWAVLNGIRDVVEFFDRI